MKKIFTFSVIICGLVSTYNKLSAQVTLTQSNHAPVPGDVRSIKVFDSLSSIISILNTSGNNVYYNFSNVIIDNGNNYMDTYVLPSSLPGSSLYINMGSNVALSDSSGFYKSGSSTLEYCGHISADGEKMEFSANKPVLMIYPFSYGSSTIDIGQGTMTAPNFPPFNLTGTVQIYGYGQGTLQLPGNAPIPGVLNVKRLIQMLIQGTGTLSAVSGTQTLLEFEYYKPGNKFPVMKVSYNRLVIPAFNVNDFSVDMEYDGSYILGGDKEFMKGEENVKIFPNPCIDKINIEFSSLNGLYEYKIMSVDGKVWDKNIFEKEINISGLDRGIYFIVIERNGIVVGRHKIIKE